MNFTTISRRRKPGLCRYASLSLCLLTGAGIFAASPDPQKTRELVAVVQSNADLAERARALQQLALVASQDAIPALTALLADEKLGQYARDVLEGMPDPAAGAALRAALGRQKGKALIGVVNSLGVRRDAQAVEALGRLAADPAAGAAAPALLALGRIGTPEALRIVEPAVTRGPAELRAAAAEACLITADRQRQDGQDAAALALYEKVRGAELPLPLRVAATRGAIFTSGNRGLALLIAQLHAAELDLRDLALRAIRELKDPQVTPRLVAELDRLSAPMQALVITALVDRGEAGALNAVEARAKSGDDAVRVAAVRALGKVGRASSLPILLHAAATPGNAPLAEAALASFARVPAPEADAYVLKSLPTVDPALRVKLIAVLGDRKAENATADLMKLAAGSDLEVSKAAWRALGLLARPTELPQLIRLAVPVQDEAAKALADRAIVTTAMKVLQPGRRADAVLTAFREEKDPATKAALARPLWATARAMGGSFEAFSALRATLADPVEEVHAAALRFLADWPDAAPVTALLDLANKPATAAAQREIALRGALRLVGNVAAGRERSPLDVIAALHQAARAVRTTDEKRLLIATIGEVRRPEADALLQLLLEDPTVRPEAAAAKKRVAAPAGAPKGKAKKAAAVAPPARNGPLFNGTDLGNWDGDPGVWRVRDGAIVGGSPEGNPRNEFLATTRRYRNFVLKLDYKLVGTEGFVNGGVQFRSVRVAQPPHEMSGYQADIGAGHSGCLYDESRRKKFLARATDEQIKRLEKPGDWNRYEIRCVGPRVELTLNGERTVAYVEEDASVGADGFIALQIHGNCKAEIAFRNVTVEELP